MARALWYGAVCSLALIACGESSGVSDKATSSFWSGIGGHEEREAKQLPPVVTLDPIDAGAQESPVESEPPAVPVEPPPDETPVTPETNPPPTTVDAGTDTTPDEPTPLPDDGGIVVSVCGLLGGLLCPDGLECIDGACVQVERCAPGESCDLKCESDACAMDCTGTNTCKVSCGRSATCDVSCVDANNCEPKCTEGECEIDCTGANNCDHVKCGPEAECIVHCGDETNCKLDECAKPVACPGNILVCNRPCP